MNVDIQIAIFPIIWNMFASVTIISIFIGVRLKIETVELKTRIAIIAIICVTVLTLPHMLAATTLPLEAAISLIEVTAYSRKSTIITAMQSQQPSCTKHKSAESTKILSANGSANLPKSVTKLRFLAILPSNKSVMDAVINISKATK